MELVADESVDFEIVRQLRKKGVTVHSILEHSSGIDDAAVLKLAGKKKCLLMTEDKDFGELTYRLKLPHTGILLIRLAEMHRADRIHYVIQVIEKYFDKLKNNFSVLNAKGLRIKPHHR